MVNDRFAQLIARKLSGEARTEEIQELENLLKENPRCQYFFAVVSDYWHSHPKLESNQIQEDVQFQQILAIAEKEMEENSGSQWADSFAKKPAAVFTLKRFLIAAALLIVFASSYLFIRYSGRPHKNDLALNEVTTKPGAKTSFLLPDGSKVWLNSESKLEYKSNFNDSIREVTLEGEAFFDVVKDKKHPFIVHTSDIDVRVLGTAFNVKSYPKESSIEATLIRGLIEITNKRDPASPKLILHPHDKLVFNKESAMAETTVGKPQEISLRKPFAITTVPKNLSDTALAETSWVYNKLLFDGETLRENAAKLERWYNVKIRFKDDKAGNTPIRYPLSNETIEEALKALQYIEPFHYRINGREIEIWKK